MLTDERKAEIRRLVAQLPEGERVRAAVHALRHEYVREVDDLSGLVPLYTTSLDAFMRDVEPWLNERYAYITIYGKASRDDEPGAVVRVAGVDAGDADHAVHATACCLALLRAVGLEGVIDD